MRNPTAGAPVPLLAADFADVGGAAALDLLPSRLAVLLYLARVVGPRSGTGRATLYQMATGTSLSERTVSRCLVDLADAGLISWRPGYATHGRPVPGRVTVWKRVLVLVIKAFRGIAAANVKAHGREVLDRIKGMTTRPPRTRGLVSDTVSTPLPKWGRPTAPSPLRGRVSADASLCPHGYADPQNCPNCEVPTDSDGYCLAHGGVVGKCPQCRRLRVV